MKLTIDARRYRDLLIVCNVQASSGPNDTAGLFYMLDDDDENGSSSRQTQNMQKRMERLEDGMDADLFRKGVMRKNLATKCRSKVCCFWFVAGSLICKH